MRKPTNRKKKPVTEATTPNVAAAVEEAKTPRTLTEKLAAAKALVAKYEKELYFEAFANDVRVDDVIVFSFGRGDKKRELTGTVTGTKQDDAQGLLIRAIVGEGFDAEAYKTFARDVIRNETGDARRAADEAAAPADGADIGEGGAEDVSKDAEEAAKAEAPVDPLDAA